MPIKNKFLVKTNNVCDKLIYFMGKHIDFSRKKFYNLGESVMKRCVL